MCIVIADRLEKLSDFGGELADLDLEKQDLIEEFRLLAEDKTADFDEFNSLFDDLYNWGDTSIDGKFGGKKVCWIN